MTDDPNAPQDRVAQLFMDRKGLGHLKPVTIEKVEGEPCWYFYYELPDEGKLELEVVWNEAEGWDVTVTTFKPTD